MLVKIIESIGDFLNFLKVKLETTNTFFSKKYLEKKIFFYNTRKKKYSFFIKQDTLREEFQKAEQLKRESILSVRYASEKFFLHPNKWIEFVLLTFIKDPEKKLNKVKEWYWKEAKEQFYLFFRILILGPPKKRARKVWIVRRTGLDKILWVLEKFYKIARFITKITIFFIDANLIFFHYFIYIFLTINISYFLCNYNLFEISESVLYHVEYKSLSQKCLEFIFYYLIVPPCKFIWYYLDIILNGEDYYDEYERMIQIKVTDEVMQTTDDKDLEYITYLRDHNYSKEYQMDKLYNYILPFEFPKQKNSWFSF